ncbi:MAG: hypothetical protein M1503_03535 [Thaumarchaeota archaeon]|nr:hypothetical protein [Nitrososphaerota archaeon]MCL5317325.1 hypothetical protein [Nitrososphaerota archaeon]
MSYSPPLGVVEGDYSSYVLDTTFTYNAVGSISTPRGLVVVDADCNMAWQDNRPQMWFMKKDGTVIKNYSLAGISDNRCWQRVVSSVHKKYIVLLDDKNFNLFIYKDGALLQTIAIPSNFDLFTSEFAIGIEETGRFIVLIGANSDVNSNRLAVYRGT